jgi:hypothetical protein
MASMILSENLLGHLTKRQKALILKYYQLTTSPSLPSGSKDEILSMIDEEAKKLDRILRRAEKDTELSMYLDLIDYFCVSTPENQILSDDKRAYLGEYVGTLVEPKQNTANSSSLVDVLVQCSDGSPVSFTASIDREKLAEAANLADLPELNMEICNRCNTKNLEHLTVLITDTRWTDKNKTY